MPFEVLVHHGYNTYREITGDATTYLEKSYAFACRVISIPISQPNHVFDTIFYGAGL
jgi:hypothetical protein